VPRRIGLRSCGDTTTGYAVGKDGFEMSRRLRVLDCFGTVVFAPGGRPDHRKMADAFADTFGCETAVAKSFIYPVVAHAWLPQTPSLDVAAHVRKVAGRLSVPEQDVLDFLWQSVGPGRSGWTVPPGVFRALGAWRAAGGELRMLTNCALTPQQLDVALEDLGIRSFFSVVMASSGGEGKKPQESWYRTAFEGDFDDVAMIGDHPTFDIEPARALGIPALRVTGPEVWEDLPAILRPAPCPAADPDVMTRSTD
jgi:phosphoglycolate phosphatase-like HAD superfamily hydrolase